MTLDDALRIVKQTDQRIGSIMPAYAPAKVALDGEFSVEEVEAIAKIMREVPQHEW